MATPNNVWVGTNAADIQILDTDATVIADWRGRAGSDYIQLDAPVVEESLIQGNENDDDIVLISEVSTSNTIYGGSGNDDIEIFAGSAKGDQYWGDGGNDDIVLREGKFSSITIKADSADELKYGNDSVYISEDVTSFNQGSVDLGDNKNSILGPVVADVVEYFFNLSKYDYYDFDMTDFAEFGEEVLIVEAAEVYQSTFTGGKGSDIMALTPFAEDATAFSDSILNGNEDQDLIAFLRDIEDSEILGGQGDDIILGLSGLASGSEFNGNKGSDTILMAGLLIDDSGIYGGKEDDVIVAAGVEAKNALISGDLGDDTLDFLAVQSTDTTIDGGEGDDVINDYSAALRTLDTYLSGGDGDDVITQASGIVLAPLADFGTTIDGGTGADIMTGDSTTQTSTVDVAEFLIDDLGLPVGVISPDIAALIAGVVSYGPKGYSDLELVDLTLTNTGSFELEGLSKDTFSFAFGDSVINEEGVGCDTITDFDSDASFYRNVSPASSVFPQNADPENVYNYDRNGESFGGLADLQRDAIALTDENGVKVNIKKGESGTLDGGIDYIVNSKGLVIGGINSLSQFIEAGGQQDKGDALLWTENAEPYTTTYLFDGPAFSYGIRSYLFIADGTKGLSDGDLLVALDNVALTDEKGKVDANGGLVIEGGEITNISTVFPIDPLWVG